MPTLGSSLASTALRVPDRVAIIDGELAWTYEELDARVNQLARELSEIGLERGDRCALIAGNSAHYFEVLYAVVRLGAIFVPINPRSAPPEVTHMLQDSGAKIVITEPGTSELVDATANPTVLQRNLGGSSESDDILRAAAAKDAGPLPNHVQESDDAVIIYTSGTTGLAKGALMDHHRLLWTGVSISMATAGIKEGSTLLHVAPMYHSGQLVLMMIAGVNLGARHVIHQQFDPVAVVKAIASERINALFGVPTMYQFILQAQAELQLDLSSWTAGYYGAAPMPAETAARIRKDLPHADIYSFYGQTEAGPNGIFSYPHEVTARPDVTGYRAAPWMAVRIAHPDGRAVAPGEVGEVLLQGVGVMKGYWNNPEATAETIRDGWLHTGDLARLDADGGMTIVDRLKDMIISGGRNIYSAEVELAMASHPGVSDCAVIGRPHEAYGESVVAVVLPKPGVDLTIDDIRDHCASRIADYKLPRELQIVEAVPRNASGKVLKRQLRESLAS